MLMTSHDIIVMIGAVGLGEWGGYEKYTSLPIVAKSLTNVCQNNLNNFLPNSQTNGPHAMYIKL